MEAFVGYVDLDGTPKLEENYCRNYQFDSAFTAPWCFTGLNSWEYCKIDFCGKYTSEMC